MEALTESLAGISPLALGLLGSLIAGLGTGLGALPMFHIPRLSPRAEDLLLGFSAGIMLPWGLALAAGAMLFVISNEIIPETHRRGHEASVTFSLLGGFGLMMYLDSALG